MASPMAVALGDQVHSEMTELGNQNAAKMFAAEKLALSENEQMYVEIGVQAGLHAALRVLADKDWIRLEVLP